MTKPPLTYGRSFLDELLLAIIAANPIEGEQSTPQIRLNVARKALFGLIGEAGAPVANLNDAMLGLGFRFDDSLQKGEVPKFAKHPPPNIVRRLAKKELGPKAAKAAVDALTSRFDDNYDQIMKWVNSSFESEREIHSDLRAIDAIFQKHGLKLKIYGIKDLRAGAKKRASRRPRARA